MILNVVYQLFFDVLVTDVIVTIEPKEIVADVITMCYNG